MLNILVIIFVIGAVIYAIFIAPKIAATIAAKKNLNYGKWFFNSIIFNVLAFIYLYTLLDSEEYAEKRTLLILIFIYMGIFTGAYFIDKYTIF